MNNVEIWWWNTEILAIPKIVLLFSESNNNWEKFSCKEANTEKEWEKLVKGMQIKDRILAAS